MVSALRFVSDYGGQANFECIVQMTQLHSIKFKIQDYENLICINTTIRVPL